MISRSGTRTSLAASGMTKILRDDGSGPVVTAGMVVSGLERMFIIYPPLNFYLSIPSLRAKRSNPWLSKMVKWIASSLALLAMTVGRPVRSSRGLRVLAEPGAYPCVGVGVLGDVADDGDGIRAGSKNLGGLLKLNAADRHQRDVADALLPVGDFCNALRREAHRFQRGRKDWPERDVIRLGAQRGR